MSCIPDFLTNESVCMFIYLSIYLLIDFLKNPDAMISVQFSET